MTQQGLHLKVVHKHMIKPNFIAPRTTGTLDYYIITISTSYKHIFMSLFPIRMNNNEKYGLPSLEMCYGNVLFTYQKDFERIRMSRKKFSVVSLLKKKLKSETPVFVLRKNDHG